MKKPKRLESEIQREILLALNALPDTLAFRVQSTGIPDGIGGFRKNHNRGISDILVCKNGRFMALEVKREGGEATPEQRQFLEKVSQAKGCAYIVHSVEEAVEFWREI